MPAAPARSPVVLPLITDEVVARLNGAAALVELALLSRGIYASVTGGGPTDDGRTVFDLEAPGFRHTSYIPGLLPELAASLHADQCSFRQVGPGRLQLEVEGFSNG